MKHTPELKMAAKQLYIDGFKLQDIATELKINVKTVSTWKKESGDAWEKARAVAGTNAIEHLSRAFIGKLVLEFSNALDAMDSATFDGDKVRTLCDMSDKFAKAVTANQRLMPEVDKEQIVLKTVQGLGEVIQKHAPEILEKFVECVQILLD